ncbi:hypothetical protein ACHOLT_01300 [Desulfitobacterium sp. Sab5]|uniref:hypothetical protein n=1 Tax=Desulfitobacterium nosdiversum TaxID=3375356 RepID=UPI003CF0688D
MPDSSQKVNTQNGERIDISQEPGDGKVLAEIIGDGTNAATERANALAHELCIPVFDNNEDIVI